MGRYVQRAAIPLVVIAVAWLSISGAAANASPPARTLKAGDAAPDLRLPATDGAVVSLADLRGKVVLVDFWASWCGPCQAAFPALSDLYRELRDRGFAVVAVNVGDKREDADAFLAQRPHSMTVVFDSNGSTPSAFGVSAMPTSFLIDRDGRVRFIHVGYTSKTIEAYRREIVDLLERTSQ